MNKAFPEEKQFKCPYTPTTPVISLNIIQPASPIVCPQTGQSERENHTIPGPAGMKLIEATPHFHPTIAEIWTYPAEKMAARISRPMIA
jgi:hypothetical protein